MEGIECADRRHDDVRLARKPDELQPLHEPPAAILLIGARRRYVMQHVSVMHAAIRPAEGGQVLVRDVVGFSLWTNPRADVYPPASKGERCQLPETRALISRSTLFL